MPAPSIAIGPPRETALAGDRTSVVATVVLGSLVAYLAFRVVDWAVLNAVWTLPAGADSSACRAASGHGACWAVIHERARFMLMGVYPLDAQWRAGLACMLFVALYPVSTVRRFWTRWLPAFWLGVPAAAIVLLHGGVLGLSVVPSEYWGGLPLTFLLSTVGFIAAFPLAVMLALGRRSSLPVIRALCVAYIEILRGVPFITVLFMASVMFPLFVPQGMAVDKLLRAQIAFAMFAAAYLAEVVRGGLEAIPDGQYEAAASLGLTFWPATMLVALPQALRISIPAIVNTFIAFFKDTSLVTVIGLFDLLGTGKAVIVDSRWVGFGVEVYLFVAAIYFAFCYAVSRYSQRLEAAMAAQGHR